MMKILALDYGERKIGLAIASTPLAEPYGVVKTAKWQEKIREVCQKEQVDKIVVGISEGKMAEKQREFARKLRQVLNLPVLLVDETLTSREAIGKMREVGRKGEEDKFAATLLLQRFLDKLNV